MKTLFPYSNWNLQKSPRQQRMHPSEMEPQQKMPDTRQKDYEPPHDATLQEELKRLGGMITGGQRRNSPTAGTDHLKDPKFLAEIDKIVASHTHPEHGGKLTRHGVLNGVLQAAGRPPVPNEDGEAEHQKLVNNDAPSSGMILGEKSQQKHPHIAINQLHPDHRRNVPEMSSQLKNNPEFRHSSEFANMVNDMAQGSGMHPTEVVQTIENHAGIPHLPTPNGR
jgi:hypothetical protein